MHKRQPLKLLASIILTFSAGFLGSLATTPNIPTWYEALEKPFFNPPNWVFAPVWTLLYLLMGISLYLVWTSRSRKPKHHAFAIFGVQLILNTLWSVVFFGLHQPWLAVLVIATLVVAIAMTMRLFFRHSRMACWLLIPYLAWVSFATILNIAVAALN